MRNLVIVFICLFFFSSNAQALKKIGKGVVEKTLKIVGKETIESSEIIIKRVFKEDISEKILKNYDDDVIERLAKLLTENTKMGDLLPSSDSAFKIWLMMGKTKAANNVNMVRYFGRVMNDLGEQGLKSKYVFQESGEVLVIKNNTGRQIATIRDDYVYVKPWKGEKDLNPLLSEFKLIPSTTFKINGQFYTTLDNGNYKEISGVLTYLPKSKPSRSREVQYLSKKVKDGVPETRKGKYLVTLSGKTIYKDEGGHILANMFGGGSELYNIIPMSKKLNRGKWAEMERVWRKSLKEGKKVDYKITPIYESNSQRPDKIFVTYTIEGKRTSTSFDNNKF
jgi:hypothetical protein